MRALLVVLVLASLLWLSLRGFRSARAAPEKEPEVAGFLLTQEPRAETPPPAAPAAPTPEATKPPATKLVEAPKQVESPKPAPPAPAPVVAQQAPAASASDEIAVAALLLHHPQEVPAYLEGAGRSLPTGRKELALALHRGLVGPADEARRLAEELETMDGVLVAEAAFAKEGIAPAKTATPAAGEAPLITAAALARLAQDAQAALAAGKHREAALAYGNLIAGEVRAPWKADKAALTAWSDALHQAQASYRWSPRGEWQSVDVAVTGGDSLISVRKRAIQEHPELLICTGQIERANGIRGATIHPGQVLRIPVARASVLVDLDAHWALYRLGAEVVAAWEVGVGKPGSETALGEYVVGEKTKEPPWFRPGHAPVPYGDPENPLGTRWIAWQKPDGTNTGLGFHGTKDPASIGEDQSQGCVRMRQPAIEELFEILPKGAVVTVQP